MPAQVPPLSQHCQPVVSLPVARDGNGSLNRSNSTELLPLNVVATDDQNGTDCAASGIGFWHVASAEAQPDELPVYRPSVQCRSRMTSNPLLFNRLTYCLIAAW